jgi:hypothetical protein
LEGGIEVGEGDRPTLRRELSDLVLEVADVDEFDWSGELTVLDSAESIDDLWTMEATAEALMRATREVLNRVRELMIGDVAEFGSVMLGDTLYRAAPDSKRKIIPGQEGVLLDWLDDRLRDAVNPNAIRITSVRAIAEDRDVDPVMVEDTFYEKVEEEDAPMKLVKMPRTRAPKYAQAMKHGDRR